MIQKIFIWTSPLPLLTYWLGMIYIRQFDGWGRGAAGILLLGPILLSLLMGVMGIILIVKTRKRRESTANLWFSTLMAGSMALFFIFKAIILELVKSFG